MEIHEILYLRIQLWQYPNPNVLLGIIGEKERGWWIRINYGVIITINQGWKFHGKPQNMKVAGTREHYAAKSGQAH